MIGIIWFLLYLSLTLIEKRKAFLRRSGDYTETILYLNFLNYVLIILAWTFLDPDQENFYSLRYMALNSALGFYVCDVIFVLLEKTRDWRLTCVHHVLSITLLAFGLYDEKYQALCLHGLFAGATGFMYFVLNLIRLIAGNETERRPSSLLIGRWKALSHLPSFKTRIHSTHSIFRFFGRAIFVPWMWFTAVLGCGFPLPFVIFSGLFMSLGWYYVWAMTRDFIITRISRK